MILTIPQREILTASQVVAVNNQVVIDDLHVLIARKIWAADRSKRPMLYAFEDDYARLLDHMTSRTKETAPSFTTWYLNKMNDVLGLEALIQLSPQIDELILEHKIQALTSPIDWIRVRARQIINS